MGQFFYISNLNMHSVICMQNIDKRKLVFIEKNGVINFRTFLNKNSTHLPQRSDDTLGY